VRSGKRSCIQGCPVCELGNAAANSQTRVRTGIALMRIGKAILRTRLGISLFGWGLSFQARVFANTQFSVRILSRFCELASRLGESASLGSELPNRFANSLVFLAVGLASLRVRTRRCEFACRPCRFSWWLPGSQMQMRIAKSKCELPNSIPSKQHAHPCSHAF